MLGSKLGDTRVRCHSKVYVINHLLSRCSSATSKRAAFNVLLRCFLKNCVVGVRKDKFPTTHDIRVYMNPVDFAILSTLRTNIISKRPCSTMSIREPSTIFLIGVLTTSFRSS